MFVSLMNRLRAPAGVTRQRANESDVSVAESPPVAPPAMRDNLPHDSTAVNERFGDRQNSPSANTIPSPSTAVEIIPPRRTTREAIALETGMAALAHALNQPIALEIAGTARSRRFIARATEGVTLDHLVQQLQARYSQAVIRPLTAENDPLHVEPGEKAAVLELRPGAAPYLPLRTPGVRESAQEGADPLLGLVAAFNGVSGEQRIIAQLALVPAPATWSTVHQRLAVEHPLEPEREQERWTMAQARMSGMPGYLDGQSLSLPAVLGLLTLVGLTFLIWRNANRFPSWLRGDATALLHHQAVHFTAAQTMQIVAWGIGILLALLVLVLVIAWIRGQLRTRLSRTALYDQRLVQEKTMRVAYRARLRIIAIGPEEYHTDRHRQALGGFISAYRQFHLATGAYFTPHWLSARAARRLIPANGAWTQSAAAGQPAIHRWQSLMHPGWLLVVLKHMFPGGWQRGLRRSAHFLSVADVAALWHLPQADDLDDLPFIEHTRARTLLAPDALTLPGAGFRVGASTHAGHTIPVYLPPDAARRNALAIAKTGKGKSTLLLALAQAALVDELGLVLIDPHGDLAEAVLALIPGTRREDTLLVDLGDREHPIGLNLLDTTLFPDRDKAVSNLIAVFSQIWKNFWGARMESALEAALKTLYEVNEAEVAADPQDGPDRQFTLLDVTALLTYAGFRHGLLGRVRDPALLDYWVRFEALQPRFQQEIITPVTTKLDKFANSVVARRIVGQGRSTLSMAEMVRRGQVLLVKTARGVVGHDVAALIGATLLGLLQVTIGEQANLAAGVRRPVRVIVDEFQVLPGVDFGAMLAELRKFGASFALATQALAYLDELDRALRPTVMANVDQLFCYAMSAEDARMVERELDGVVTISDLIALDDFHCYARLTVLGQRVPVFSLALDPPTHLDEQQREQAEALRHRSQRRIGREAQRVEMLISHAVLRRKALALLSGNAFSNNSANSAHADKQTAAEQGGILMKPLQEESPSAYDTTAGQQRGKTRRRRSRHAKTPAFTAMLLAENPSTTTRSDSNDAEGAGDADDDDGGEESADSEESESDR